MKIAVISDIHSNLEALNSALDKCREKQIEQYICVGDIVGYNADPAECIKKVKSLTFFAIVKGNHDDISASKKDISRYNKHAKESVLWTRKNIPWLNKIWLSKLPLKIVKGGNNITVVHSTLTDPEKWGYILDKETAEKNFKFLTTDICFCGHSHTPALFIKNKQSSLIEQDIEFTSTKSNTYTYKIEKGNEYIINPGSIGQPRNNDPRASFIVYDTNEKLITKYRVKYDIRTAQDKIYNTELPAFNGDRLSTGV